MIDCYPFNIYTIQYLLSRGICLETMLDFGRENRFRHGPSCPRFICNANTKIAKNKKNEKKRRKTEKQQSYARVFVICFPITRNLYARLNTVTTLKRLIYIILRTT